MSIYSSVGMSITSQEELKGLLEQALDAAEAAGEEEVTVAGGAYGVWRSGDGAELWVQYDPGRTIVGANPHFAGPGRMRVELTTRIARPELSLLDGAFLCWAAPGEAGQAPQEAPGGFPFAFDAPDAARWEALPLPCVRELQVAAFAIELSSFRSEEELVAARDPSAPALAPEAFIPSGLFAAARDPSAPAQAQAIVSGRVLAAEVLENPLTRARYQWAHVRTYGGSLDVVADPALLPAPLAPGFLVSGSFWLSGRIRRAIP